VIITGGFTGMVLGAQRISNSTRSRWTPPRWSGERVVVRRTRPVLTALMVAGRVGLHRAEIGTMA